jgi:hypothetical protein
VPGELGRGGDRPGEERDRPREPRELSTPPRTRDYLAQPMTPREIDLLNKTARGELRWIGDKWVESEPYDYVKQQDRVQRMRDEVGLPDSVRELPNARDVMPNLHWAEVDRRKFDEYSLNPDHPQNHRKADGWRALGYDVDDPQSRRAAGQDLKDLISHGLLADGKVAQTDETAYGQRHKVLNGFIGPNGKHGTLVTCWLIADQGERGYPRMTTTWVMPHRDKETGR